MKTLRDCELPRFGRVLIGIRNHRVHNSMDLTEEVQVSKQVGDASGRWMSHRDEGNQACHHHSAFLFFHVGFETNHVAF